MKIFKYSSTAFLLVLLSSCITIPAHAQIEDIGQIMQASKDDINTLTEAYLEPFGKGFGAGLNTGWTNTAKTHNTLGFDITVSGGLAIVPDNDLTFDVSELALQELEIKSGSPVTSTINGPDQTGPTMAAYSDYDNDGDPEELFNFDMPEGADFGYVPAPMIKAGVGVIKNTDIMLRYTPEYDIPGVGGSTQLFGVGVKHDIKQWLPGGNLLPVDLTMMFGYTSMDVNADLSLTAQDVIQGRSGIKNEYPESTWNGQTIEMATDAWTVNALIGKTLPVISVYGGVGYEASTLSITTPGNYPTITKNDTGGNEPLRVKTTENPVDLELKGDNGLRALAGFRLRFTIFHISGSYTLSNYPSYNLGFGISFR